MTSPRPFIPPLSSSLAAEAPAVPSPQCTTAPLPAGTPRNRPGNDRTRAGRQTTCSLPGGPDPCVKRYNEFLRGLIVAGKATPSLPISHEVALDDAADAYDKFDMRADGYTKVLLHPVAAV